MAQALGLCPDLVCLPVNMPLYVNVSRQIRDIFYRYTPEIEPLSLDEAFLDVAGSEKLFGTAAVIAQKIKRNIKNECKLIASAGVAPNKFVAKIASDIDKPDGEAIRLEGELPSPTNPPSGCHFHPRCPSATDACRKAYPEVTLLEGERQVRCFLYQT